EYEGFARAGDTLVLRGVGFGSGSRVLFEGVGRGATPDSASPNELSVIVPEGATGGVRVLVDDEVSQRIDLELRSAGAPLLRPIAPLGAIGTSTRTAIEGENLASVLQAQLDSGFIGIWGSTAGRIELSFAEAAHRGELRVRNAAGWSNPIFVRQATTTSGRVEVPDSVALTPDALVVQSSLSDDAMDVSASGTFFGPVAQGEVELLGAYLPDVGGDRAALLGLLFPGASSPVLNARSTALAMVFSAAVETGEFEPGRLQAIHEALDMLPEIDALEAAIVAAMGADPTAVHALPSSVGAPLRAALVAADSILENEEPSPFPGGLVSLVSPETRDDVTVRHLANDPLGLEVVNNTRLYLSMQVERSDGVVPVRHPNHAFGEGILGPQGSLLQLFEPTTRRYAAPRGHNAQAIVITGGLASPGPRPAEEAIHQIVVLRPMVAKVFVPILGVVLGDVFDKKTLMHGVMNAFIANAVAGTESIFTAGDAGAGRGRAALGAFIDVLINDLTDAGPITQAVGDALQAGALRAAAALPARIAARIIPVVNGLRLALDGIEAAGTFINLAVTANDLATTSGRLDFSVSFGVEARLAIPSWLDEADLEGPQTFFIEGQGFVPRFDADGDLAYPEIIFVPDTGDTATVATPDYILTDRTRMQVEAPEEVMANVRDSLEIRVQAGPDEPEITLPTIPVRFEASVERAVPAIAQAGDVVTLVGVGFAERVSENEIVLVSGTRRVRVRPTGASPRSVSFVLPGGVDEGGEWQASVDVGPFGAAEETNAVPITVGSHFAIGRWTISAGWEAEPYAQFYDRETGACVPITSSLLPGQGAWALWFTADGRVYGGRCNPSSLFRCGQNVRPTGQSYLGTWSALPDGGAQVQMPNSCPPSGNEPTRPTQWSLQFTDTTLVGTTVNGCVNSRPCGVTFTPPTYDVSGNRVGF
ncbi:MAG: hypothetical protein AAF645_14245, partial [Myxococcota bacterium]